MQSARLLEISTILAIQPLDSLQKEALRASLLLFDSNGIIEGTANGLDWPRAAEQFSQIFAVAKYLMF